MGVGSGEQGGRGIFIHDTNIVDRRLKVLFFGVFLLFFGLFFRCSPPWKRLDSAIFNLFLLFFGLFFPLPLLPGRGLIVLFLVFLVFSVFFPLLPLPLRNVSLDALEYHCDCEKCLIAP